MNVQLFRIFGVATTIAYCCASEGWTYSEQGPEKWAASYPECAGQFQSPIDLVDAEVKYNSSLKTVKMLQLSEVRIEQLSLDLSNNGHSAQISFPEGTFGVSFEGTDRADYEVKQLHFHWGSDEKGGSEHTINGKAYVMETHVVTFNKSYGDFQTALTKSDGLAVLGFLHVINDAARPDENQISVMGISGTDLRKIRKAGKTTKMRGFNLLKIMGQIDPNSYYRYGGSLTTPPCTENVMWTIFGRPVSITNKQV
ncbi:Carbonic anhydrase 6 [Clonorchis sinensis]|uniref:carbonic anhydrase n=2 Tax=Clonorchis sinensis TaxID=79923 RepID=H2KQV0_CLOSI|nr:Carbonic anhydrase 6 [Clonorchis sinensis]GAA43377.2 carbonic anhydrase [Clonorchis sinensis]